MKWKSINKISLKKRPLIFWLTLYILLLPFLFGTLDLLGVPRAVRYSIDAVWIGVLVFTMCKPKVRIRREIFPQACLIGIWVLYTVVVYLFQYQSVLYYFWGFRNNFRYYVAFLMFVAFLKEDTVAYSLKWIDRLFWINAAVCIFQFFVLGYQQDYLGGIFGVERGANAYTLVFFCVVLTQSLLSMMNGEESLTRCLTKCALALLIGAFAELFALYLFFGVILVMAAMCTRFSWKKCALFAAMVLMLMVCNTILLELFGKGSQLSLESVTRRLFAKNYATNQDLGRFTAIATLSKNYVTSVPEQLFGLGLGNCETSSFAMFNTPFYQNHSLLHYTWFMSAFLFLETGYLGVAMYIGFFVLCFVCAWKQSRKKNRKLTYCHITLIMAVICIMMTFYNSSMRTEAGYMGYFALSLAFIDTRDRAMKA